MSTEAFGMAFASEPDGNLILDSCHCSWVFSEDRHLFRRVLKANHLRFPVSTDWRRYDHLEITPDSDSFVVVLDPLRERSLRSWRHLARKCKRCGAEPEPVDAEDAPTAGYAAAKLGQNRIHFPPFVATVHRVQAMLRFAGGDPAKLRACRFARARSAVTGGTSG